MHTENVIDYPNYWMPQSLDFLRNSIFSMSLQALTEEQQKATLALERLEDTQKILLASLSNQESKRDWLDTSNDAVTIITLIDILSKGEFVKWIGRKAAPLIKPAMEILPKALPVLSNPITLGLAAMTGGMYGTINLLEYEMQMGWIERPSIDAMNKTAAGIDAIMAASNPHITPYDAVTELPAGRRARSTKAKLAESKERQANIAMALETLNNVGKIYAASSPISYDEPATFNDWQNLWFRTLDAQQSILKSGYKKAAMTAA